MQLLADVDEDGSGSLDFGDLRRLNVAMREMQEKMMYERELCAAEVTRFSKLEVEELRELYQGYGGSESAAGGIEHDQVESFLSRLKPMGTKLREDFSAHWDEVARQSGERRRKEGQQEDDSWQAAFPEFLKLMRRLMDVNFAGIWESTKDSSDDSD